MSTAGLNESPQPLTGNAWPIRSRQRSLAAPAGRPQADSGAESTKLQAGDHEDGGGSRPPGRRPGSGP